MSFPVVRLQPQRHRRAAAGHPWIYSNEVVMNTETKAIVPGTIVQFRAHDGRIVGKGSFNPHTLIAGRIFTRNGVEAIDGDWLATRLKDALALREQIIPEPFYRLIHAEADGLPGLIIDRFGAYLSVQLNTAGMEKLWPQIEAALKDALHPKGITLRNDNAAREMEGLVRVNKIAFGEIPEIVEVRENSMSYFADIKGGQKTGWYFDQRDNHALVARYCPKATNVLDLYTHAGGFALLAARVGAKKITGIDSSEAALELAKKTAIYNKLPQCNFHRADVFEDLDGLINAKEKFDVVIADPPAFVKARKDAASGAKGYRKLARLAASVTTPKGILFIASCSHNMDLATFSQQVAAGLFEAGREGRVLHTVFAASDHPVHPHLSESAYLKGILIRLD